MPSSLFSSPEHLRVLWHDLQKAPTAMQAFLENMQGGVYGKLPPDVQTSLGTLAATSTEQELLLRTVQLLNKCEAGIALGTPQRIQAAASIQATVRRLTPWLTVRKRPITLAVQTTTLSLPKDGWDGVVILLVGTAGFLPKGTDLRLAGTLHEGRYTLTLAATGIGALPPETRAARITALFTKTPTPWTNAARCLYVLRKLAPALGGKVTTAPNTLIQLTLPLS